MARILIVEDDADLSAVLADCLRHEGYATDLAGTGVEALDRLSRGEYDVMLLDRDLPVLSGDEVMRTVDRLRIPVCTASTSEPTTTCPNRSPIPNSSPASARSCAAATPTTRPP